MKFMLSEITKNLQGTNSGVDEAKNQINDLEHKEATKQNKTAPPKTKQKNNQSE